jgi:hypothetical protein
MAAGAARATLNSLATTANDVATLT